MRNPFCARWVGRHSVDRRFSLAQTRLIRLLCIVGVFAATKVSVVLLRTGAENFDSRAPVKRGLTPRRGAVSMGISSCPTGDRPVTVEASPHIDRKSTRLNSSHLVIS